jgi:hypothetical protein
MTLTDESPISFMANVKRLPTKGMPLKITADERQREGLAESHELAALPFFEADLLVTAWKKDGVKVTGTVRAHVVQECVVTLEPVEDKIEADVDALFVPEGSKLARPQLSSEAEMLLDAEGPDAPEVFSGDAIDVGALAEQFFALALNPYPRKSDAKLDAAPQEEAQETRGPLYDKLKGLANNS